MSQTLPIELDGLVFRGTAARGAVPDEQIFLMEVAEATVSGLVTEQQSAVLCALLGLGEADRRAAIRRAS